MVGTGSTPQNKKDHGWNLKGPTTTTTIMVRTQGLTFTGYVGSNIGIVARVYITGHDVNKLFTEQKVARSV